MVGYNTGSAGDSWLAATRNTLVSEQWELVNLTGEDHNFHIHQTKFRVMTDGELTAGLSNLSAQSILQAAYPC